MPKVKSEQLKEGMVTATEVRNMDQMLLLPAGCKLTPKHIDIIQAWGITDVQIEAAADNPEPDDPLAKLPPEELARLTDQTKALFWDANFNHPAQVMIFQLALRRHALKKGRHG